MPTHVDHLQRTVYLPTPPRRIISLVPSQTELLWSLGLDDRVVGITKFCVHPKEWYLTKTRIGGTKQLHLDRIDALTPDLIIANREENEREQILALAEKYPVWVSDVKTLPNALDLITRLGQVTDTQAKAGFLRQQLTTAFNSFRPLDPPIPTAYLIWRNPYMTVGHDTFIHDILQRCGWSNVFGTHKRYPTLTPAQLSHCAARLIFLSSEPYSFGEKHLAEFQELCPQADVHLVDGEMFSWYGSRMVHAVNYLSLLIERCHKINTV